MAGKPNPFVQKRNEKIRREYERRTKIKKEPPKWVIFDFKKRYKLAESTIRDILYRP